MNNKSNHHSRLFLLGITLALGAAISVGIIQNHNNILETKAAVQSGWSRVTSISDITAGGTFIIGYEATASSDVIVPLRSDGAAATTSATGLLYSGTTAGSATSTTINMSSIADTSFYEVAVTASSTTTGAVNIALASGNFIGNSGAKNTAKLYAAASLNTDYTPTIGSNDVVTLTSPTSVSTTYTTLQYNTSSPRFVNYGGTQKNVVFYKKGATATLSSISVSGTLSKTSYYDGESFSSTGLIITANYSDSSSADVTSDCTYTPNPLTAGTTSVTASYTQGGVTKTASISGITVAARTLVSISVLTSPTKVSYMIGQSFSPTGMKIRATYNVGLTNDDYTAYSYSPTAAFDSLGSKIITITSTENASISTSLSINVVDSAEGTYGITSGATVYQPVMDPASLVINKSEVLLPDLSFSDITNIRLFGSPITASIMMGSGSALGGTFTISVDSGLIISKIEFVDNDKDVGAAGTATLSVNTVSVAFSAINTTDSVVFKPYTNAAVITTTARLWTAQIVLTAHKPATASIDYGTHFLASTAEECLALNVTSATWSKLEATYDNADSSVKNLIKAADANVSGNDLEKAIARYTLIANKYGYNDYLDLGIAPQGNQGIGISQNQSSVVYIVAISFIGMTVLIGYRLLRRKNGENA